MTLVSKSSAKCRIMLVDDYTLAREALCNLIAAQADMKVVAQAVNAREALAAAAKHRPDLAIVSLVLGGSPAIEWIKKLKSAHRAIEVLMICVHDESLFAERAVRAGAKGYVLKSEPAAQIVAAARRIFSGGIYVSENVTSSMFRHLSAARQPAATGIDALSNRELEVLRMIGAGHTMRDIAKSMFRSVKTVETHRQHIKEKLHLQNSNHLIRFAAQCVTEGI